ncbi:hypothetical protein LQR31_17960 [Chromobacterium vaccinii]|uniref:hypothetical protein n=1 Tax=Chromobacterium vaccinii TaxID=1108595 RepID=UPI001E58B2CB|nr:hypothetical protein [Chromobacterium vaccinii]MCD4486362.1 hypothetical protein [Chromobacterium vaccinii]
MKSLVESVSPEKLKLELPALPSLPPRSICTGLLQLLALQNEASWGTIALLPVHEKLKTPPSGLA